MQIQPTNLTAKTTFKALKIQDENKLTGGQKFVINNISNYLVEEYEKRGYDIIAEPAPFNKVRITAVHKNPGKLDFATRRFPDYTPAENPGVDMLEVLKETDDFNLTKRNLRLCKAAFVALVLCATAAVTGAVIKCAKNVKPIVKEHVIDSLKTTSKGTLKFSNFVK